MGSVSTQWRGRELLAPDVPGGFAVITLLRLVTKAVKWSVIIAAYLVLGLAKLATILVVLLFRPPAPESGD